jgi:hypothetical protein
MKVPGINLEISGIRKIVFDQEIIYTRYPNPERDHRDWIWKYLGYKPGEFVFVSPPVFVDYEEMISRIKKLMRKQGFRVWVEGDTLNVEYKEK